MTRVTRSLLTRSWNAALHSLPPGELGDGVITGTIKDSEGSPIPGVKVRANARSGVGDNYYSIRIWDSYGRGLWKSLAEDVVDLVHRRQEFEGEAHSVRTDENGFYEIKGLPRGRTSVEPIYESYSFRSLSNRYFHEPDATVNFVGYKTTEVQVRMEADDGNPPQCRLDVVSLADYRNVHSWQARGEAAWTLKLAPGAYAVRVEDYGRVALTDQKLLVIDGSSNVDEIVLQARHRAENYLRVVIESALFGPDHFQVSCVPDVPGQDPVPLLDSTYGPEKATSGGAAHIPIALNIVDAGDYIVGIRKQSGPWLSVRRITYAAPAEPVRLKVEPPPAHECFTCVVTTHDARPLASPRFKIEREKDEIDLIPWRIADMTYRLQYPSDAEFGTASPGTLAIEDKARGSLRVELTAYTAQTIEVRFEPTGFLVLKWGKPGFKPTIKFHDGDRLVKEERYWHTNELEDGMVVTHIPPGLYSLTVMPDSRSPFPVFSGDIDIKEGFNQLEPEIGELANIRLTVQLTVHTEDIWRVEVSRVVGAQEIKESYSIGRREELVIKNLPAGSYTLRYHKRGTDENTEKTFNVPGVTEVVID